MIKNRKIIAFFFMILLITLSIHLINAYEDDPLDELRRKAASFHDFSGTDHSACHGPDEAIIPSVESQNAYLQIVISGLSYGNLIKPGDKFNISVQVKNFTELAYERILIGFPSRNPGSWRDRCGTGVHLLLPCPRSRTRATRRSPL